MRNRYNQHDREPLQKSEQVFDVGIIRKILQNIHNKMFLSSPSKFYLPELSEMELTQGCKDLLKQLSQWRSNLAADAGPDVKER